MGLDAAFKNAAATAFGIFKDIVVSARYETVATSTYDASSGVVSTHSFSQMVSMIFTRYDNRLVDKERIKPEDARVLALPSQIPSIPKANDTFHVVEAGCSTEYRIIESQYDAALALYIMQARKLKE